MAPDGSEKASFTVTEGVSPHDWEDVDVGLEATDAVLAQATVGCWYQITAEPGSGGGHELFLKDLVLRLASKSQLLWNEENMSLAVSRSYPIDEQANTGKNKSACCFLNFTPPAYACLRYDAIGLWGYPPSRFKLQ